MKTGIPSFCLCVLHLSGIMTEYEPHHQINGKLAARTSEALFLPLSGVQVGGDLVTSFHPYFWPKEMLKPVTRGDKRDAS